MRAVSCGVRKHSSASHCAARVTRHAPDTRRLLRRQCRLPVQGGSLSSQAPVARGDDALAACRLARVASMARGCEHHYARHTSNGTASRACCLDSRNNGHACERWTAACCILGVLRMYLDASTSKCVDVRPVDAPTSSRRHSCVTNASLLPLRPRGLYLLLLPLLYCCRCIVVHRLLHRSQWTGGKSRNRGAHHFLWRSSPAWAPAWASAPPCWLCLPCRWCRQAECGPGSAWQRRWPIGG